MPSLILRPNDILEAGEWNTSEGITLLESISDNKNETSVTNAAQNQGIIVNLDNVPNAQSSATFTTVTASAITTSTGKGNPSFNLNIYSSDGEVVSIFNQDFTNESGAIAHTQTTNVVTTNKNATFANGLILAFTGLLGTQLFLHELFVTVTYTEPTFAAGKITLSEGLINLTSGKISIS